MTQAIELPYPSTSASERRLVGGVCFGHLVSHYYITLLAPLFLFVREDYGVSYTELGLALTAFNVLTTVLQTPTGFLVDRVNARMVIICGLLLGAGAFAIAGLVHSFWVFVAMFAVAGIANTVYHPANYALLSQHIPPFAACASWWRAAAARPPRRDRADLRARAAAARHQDAQAANGGRAT